MKRWNGCDVATTVILGLVCMAAGCGSPAGDTPIVESEPAPKVVFEPTVAIQLRPLPDSEGQEYLGEMRTAIEDEIKKLKRVKLVEDPAAARLIIDIPFYLDKDSLKSGWYYRLQILDTKYDVAIFEDGYCQSGDVDNSKEMRDAVQLALKQSIQWLEKVSSFSRQIELGKDGVAYLETDPYSNDRITYGRYDFGLPHHKVYVDYDVRMLRNGLLAASLKASVNRLYRELKANHAELVNSPDEADVVLKISVDSGNEKSYTKQVNGVAPPAGSYGSEFSGAALSVTMKVFPIGKLQPAYNLSASPQYTLTAEGKAPKDTTYESPELQSLKSLESALETELPGLKPFLTTKPSE